MNWDGGEWGVESLWRQMDFLLRIDVGLLSVLVVLTFLVFSRISRRRYKTRHGVDVESILASSLAAELKIQIGILRSIATSATYLGLVGTCLGIINAFPAAGMEKHAYIRLVYGRLAAALVPAVVGILVAIPTVCACVFGRSRLDLFQIQLRRRNLSLSEQRLPLFPPFSVIAAPLLAILVMALMSFTSFHESMGFYVQVAPAQTNHIGRR